MGWEPGDGEDRAAGRGRRVRSDRRGERERGETNGKGGRRQIQDGHPDRGQEAPPGPRAVQRPLTPPPPCLWALHPEELPSLPQEPLSPNPTPRPGNWTCSQAKLFGNQRLCNHMNSHSLSYLFPASGFPPLAKPHGSEPRGGRGRAASPEGWKTSESERLQKAWVFLPSCDCRDSDCSSCRCRRRRVDAKDRRSATTVWLAESWMQL